MFSYFSYIQYSAISAKLTRRALKPALKVEALKREAVHAKPTMWKDGKAVGAQSKILFCFSITYFEVN
jgi:F-type H+-transporting ATPase subunit epsilon